jgi:2-keto-4-pentenoate hydratase/2-oxohepta-3-ene-1,7-dioic acid hydratase in catechol pathway
MAHNGAPGDRDLPRQAFIKSPRTIVGPGDTIVVDENLGQVNIEGELAVVIRHHCRHLTAEQVPGAILGYTIGNDVTAVEQIALDEKMTQSKNGDGFTPIGPWIETDLDSGTVPMTVKINGETVAQASTAQLAWNITEQLVYLTGYLALGPGDIVLTGAPGTFHPAKPGDQSDITLGGIGTLSNPVRSR